MISLLEPTFDRVFADLLSIPVQVKAATVALCETCGEQPATCEDPSSLIQGQPSKVCLLCLHFCLDCDSSPCVCEPYVSDNRMAFCRHEAGAVCEMCFDGADCDAEAKAKL